MIEDDIYSALKDLAEGRVYPGPAPPNSTAPYIVYQRVDAPHLTTLNRSTDVINPQIAIVPFAMENKTARAIAEDIKTIMRASTIMAELTNDPDIYDEDTGLSGVQLTYTCWEIE